MARAAPPERADQPPTGGRSAGSRSAAENPSFRAPGGEGVSRISWHGVVSVTADGLATGEALEAEPHAAQHAVALDRRIRVVGAGGLVATGRRQHWADGHLV